MRTLNINRETGKRNLFFKCPQEEVNICINIFVFIKGPCVFTLVLKVVPVALKLTLLLNKEMNALLQA